MQTNGLSIKPPKVKLLAGEQKATEACCHSNADVQLKDGDNGEEAHSQRALDVIGGRKLAFVSTLPMRELAHLFVRVALSER